MKLPCVVRWNCVIILLYMHASSDTKYNAKLSDYLTNGYESNFTNQRLYIEEIVLCIDKGIHLVLEDDTSV